MRQTAASGLTLTSQSPLAESLVLFVRSALFSRGGRHLLFVIECKQPDENAGVAQLEGFFVGEPHVKLGISAVQSPFYLGNVTESWYGE